MSFATDLEKHASLQTSPPMTKIDLTTPANALAYLRSLPADTEIEIVDARRSLPDTANDAISAIVGEAAYSWANARNRWHWVAGELVAELS